MPRSVPPFRADHVGSLLRPKRLLQAREDFAAGRIPAAELRSDAAWGQTLVDGPRVLGVQGYEHGGLLLRLQVRTAPTRQEEVCRELSPYLVRPIAQLAEEEAYTVFCVESPLQTKEGTPLSAEDWLKVHRREVASLLTQEPDVDHLSKQESDESTGRYLSYYEHDLVVVDWDAALIMDEPQNFDETLYVMELANLQLAELEAYDRILDEALERSYRDLGEQPLRRKGDVRRELREIRVDLARLSDELSNITKFFGDWHLARIYENISARFHLGDWHRTIDEKLKTLANLYQLLQHDQTNRWMLMLEATIVLLFVIDLVLLFVGLKG